MDKYKHINDKDVVIKGNTDKRGKDHVSFYDSDPSINEDHSSIHINWDSQTGEGEIIDTTSGEKVKTDVKCYLTTACIRHYQNEFNDKCEELTILRWFRDNFVSKNDIDYYYEIAPVIVQYIEKNENNNMIYDYLYENVIVKCVEAIKNGDYKYAYEKYKSSILALEQTFVNKREKRLIKIK